MATFRALNIIPDEDSEDEIDNTKELQIEEALKLYQTALKLHSQGRRFYPQALEGYDALFQSEVFRWPESQAEWNQSGDILDHIPIESDDEDAARIDALVNRSGGDSAPSSLPHILFSALKNHGQFMLDFVRPQYEAAKHQAKEGGNQHIVASEICKLAADRALWKFIEALSKDETDVELWRRAARVASSLGSRRVERFCLEAIIDQDQEGPDARVESMGLEEAFAADDLVQLIRSLHDDLSITQSPVSDFQYKYLAPSLKKYQDPLPYLPISENVANSIISAHPIVGSDPKRLEIKVGTYSWAALGQSLLQQLLLEQRNPVNPGIGAGVSITLPRTTNDGEIVGSRVQPSLESQDRSEQQPNLETTTPISGPGEGDVSEAQTSNKVEEVSSVPDAEPSTTAQEKNEESKDDTTRVSRSISPRKRSSSSAGLPDGGENGRIRSKRIRARETITDPAPFTNKDGDLQESSADLRMESLSSADEQLFSTVDSLLQRTNVLALGIIEELRNLNEVQNPEIPEDIGDLVISNAQRILVQDLRAFSENWTVEMGRTIIYGEGADDPTVSIARKSGSPNTGIMAFLEYSKANTRKMTSRLPSIGERGLAEFVHYINNDWRHVKVVAMKWIENILRPVENTSESHKVIEPASYVRDLWPDSLKEAVVRMLVALDEEIFTKYHQSTAAIIKERKTAAPNTDSSNTEIVQVLFELHLDIYSNIINPSSEVDIGTRTAQKDRCRRWYDLASDMISIHKITCDKNDPLTFRYIWASTLYSGLMTEDSRDHLIICLNDLKTLLQAADDPTIELQNNALMPEISTAAVDREISKLTTRDLFLNIFQNDTDDPVDIIETLELILDPEATQLKDSQDDEPKDPDQMTEGDENQLSGKELSDTSSQLKQMSTFLERGSVSLKLFLWQKLRNAYLSIKYIPKVFSCILRSVEAIMTDLSSPANLGNLPESRQFNLLKWLRILDDLILKALTYAMADRTARDCLDLDHLGSSLTAIAQLSRLLHSFTLYEDQIRLGQKMMPTSTQAATASYLAFVIKLRDMELRTWTLQYILLKEAMVQQKDVFPDLSIDLVKYLHAVHHATGLRRFCNGSNKAFLKFAENELCRLRVSTERNFELAQVVFDLYGLRIGDITPANHGCTPDSMRAATAIRILPTVLKAIENIPLRDLARTDYKTVLERMQQVIGTPKANSAMSHNLRTYNAYCKSTINPIRLYECLRGRGDISWVSVQSEGSKVANQAWYFLQGNIALTRFRSQKRTSATPTDDLDIARTFFKVDLQYGMDKWETWYRQAQTYDSMIDENVSWSAEKLNGHGKDLIDWQRIAIHCYTMAVAYAMRENNDDSVETAKKLSEMFTDFGFRIYASSTTPFSMAAFRMDHSKRHFSGAQGIYKQYSHSEMTDFQAWRFAAGLFRRALVDRPDYWMNHYMLGKCLWKILNHPTNLQSEFPLVAINDPIRCFVEAVNTVPERRDRQEPILEPHYKLVSIVHKLVQSKSIEPEAASEILQATPYAQKIPAWTVMESWEPYILSILKGLRTADKSNWHHRMTARTAHVIHGNESDNMLATMAAKNELSQQIFTKTMVVQVWKPEYERPGRHFVYTSRYVQFFVQLLVQLNAKASLEAMARRVRKKNTDFYRHDHVWAEVCTAYLTVLRRTGQIPEGQEESVFKSISHNTVASYSELLEKWCHDSLNTSPALDLLREVVELKKLNANCMKPAAIDDLIVDTYAQVYEAVMPGILTRISGEQNRAVMSLGNLLSSTEASKSEALTSQHLGELVLPKPRARGVSRKDILKSAEVATNKPAAPSSINGTSATRVPPLPIKITSSIDLTSTASDPDSRDALQDDADDESELSEVDEEIVEEVEEKAVLFPGLVKDSTPKVEADEQREEETDVQRAS